MPPAAPSGTSTDRFRLRHFIDELVNTDELDVHEEPVSLVELAAHLHGNPKAVLFRKAGPEGFEIVGNVIASRSRIAAALGVPAADAAREVMRRLRTPQAVVELTSADAPVHQVVLTGAEADLTRLPAHLQHFMDGGPYLSSGIDYAIDPENGWTNVGCRRLMLRGRKEAGIDLVAPSDLRAIYLKSVAQKRPLKIAFAIGSHPVDSIAANMRVPVDEMKLLASLRGAALPVVKCVTSDIRVPADVEVVLEGYLDAAGHVEPEGPYGEFFGYYGLMKNNPVFHLEAITMRRDPLFQTTTISGRSLGTTETAQIGTLRTEILVWRSLETAIREPVAVRAVAASNGCNHVRVAIRQRVPGEARNAIAAVLGSVANVKHVFVVDQDIDISSDAEMEWAMSTRFQADRDLVIMSGLRALPLDPSLEGERTGAKAGFDLTLPFGKQGALELTSPEPPPPAGRARFHSVREALAEGPLSFGGLVTQLGSADGREIVLELDELRQRGELDRLSDGTYVHRLAREKKERLGHDPC